MPRSHPIPISKENKTKILYQKHFLYLLQQLMLEPCLLMVLQIYTNRIPNYSKEESLLRTLIFIQTVFLLPPMSLYLANMKGRVHLGNHWTEEITTKAMETFHKNWINGIIIFNSHMSAWLKMMTLWKLPPTKYIGLESTMHKWEMTMRERWGAFQTPNSR